VDEVPDLGDLDELGIAEHGREAPLHLDGGDVVLLGRDEQRRLRDARGELADVM